MYEGLAGSGQVAVRVDEAEAYGATVRDALGAVVEVDETVAVALGQEAPHVRVHESLVRARRSCGVAR